ncbi:hypothetical protein J437_LFUL015527 [Ladona fulva]|uniref:G-protein coupled receptors family 2 profile 2 domain-containing protein n=1 Tax=Ladona fulva TaxID=123851 RepID=A0A8K0KH43_LADFU|nr:hypothetical protein J437_LFUL015527 [Ladona fulva]
MPLLLLCVFAVAAAAAPEASPTINKCCALDEILQPVSLECMTLDAQKILHKEASWMPSIFSPTERTLVSVPPEWKIEAPRRPPCVSPLVQRTARLSPTFLLFTNRSLLMNSPPLGFLHPNNFCLDAAGDSAGPEAELVAIVCLPLKYHPESSDSLGFYPEEDRPAEVRKCCGNRGAFNETANACIVVLSEMGSWSAPSPLRTVEGYPSCTGDDDFVLLDESGDAYASISTEDGSLMVGTSKISPDEFCVERVVLEGRDPSSPVPPPRIFVCSNVLPTPPMTDVVPYDHHDLRYTLYPIGLILSAIFLAATLAVGYILPKTHHALHWRCQTGHVASLLVGDILLAATQIAGPSVKPGVCVALGLISVFFILGVFMHYFFLAAFFWLNTMCFNIWWTFRDLRPASLDKGQELCRFRAYSLYAWGAPLFITGLGLTLDLAATDVNGPLRPRFGERRCWFYGDMEIFAYFYGPVGALLLVNLVLFLATARELTCGLWRREVAKSSPHGEGADRATLGRVCLKLVVVMGVTWVADVISWAVGGPAHAWYATDLINAFQGVLIFAVVGCQPQVWAALRRMWCCRGVGGNGQRRRELGDRAAHDDDDDYDESGAVGRFCRGGAGGGVTSSGRPVSSTTSEAGPFGSSPPHSLTWEGDVSHKENSIHQNSNSNGTKIIDKKEDKETLC